jgi:hypothetical protein
MMSTTDHHGDPLAFKVARRHGLPAPPTGPRREGFKVEARQLAHHQKEAGVPGSSGGAALPSTAEGLAGRRPGR